MNEYLLDTHTLLWYLFDHEKLSKRASDVIQDINNILHISAISIWEIALKVSKGKLELNFELDELIEICKNEGFNLVSLDPEIPPLLLKLRGFHHKDPFDRMLIVQAMAYDIPLITKDYKTGLYTIEGLKTIW